jgi:hypothetical protein
MAFAKDLNNFNPISMNTIVRFHSTFSIEMAESIVARTSCGDQTPHRKAEVHLPSSEIFRINAARVSSNGRTADLIPSSTVCVQIL